jgi:hypothetical protein
MGIVIDFYKAAAKLDANKLDANKLGGKGTSDEEMGPWARYIDSIENGGPLKVGPDGDLLKAIHNDPRFLRLKAAIDQGDFE